MTEEKRKRGRPRKNSQVALHDGGNVKVFNSYPDLKSFMDKWKRT